MASHLDNPRDVQLSLCLWEHQGEGAPPTCPASVFSALTWYEPHVEGYQALAVVDGVAGPVCLGQPLAQGTDGVSRQELGKGQV